MKTGLTAPTSREPSWYFRVLDSTSSRLNDLSLINDVKIMLAFLSLVLWLLLSLSHPKTMAHIYVGAVRQASPSARRQRFWIKPWPLHLCRWYFFQLVGLSILLRHWNSMEARVSHIAKCYPSQIRIYLNPISLTAALQSSNWWKCGPGQS